MKKKINCLIMSIFSGIMISIIIWTILKIMEGGTYLLWEFIPSKTQIPFYTVIICTIGGILLGIYKLKYGDYPEELEEVVEKVKKDKFYPYNNTFLLCIAALLPLIFGGSIGPEAGLTGIIVGLCYWAKNNLKYVKNEMPNITDIGLSSALSTIFATPLFGLVMPLEKKTDKDEEIVIPKSSKIFFTIITTLASVLTFISLNNIFGGEVGMPHIEKALITNKERIWGILIIIIGIIFGYMYLIFSKSTQRVFSKIKNKTNILWSTILGGIILGIMGTVLPLTMFSGESQMAQLGEEYLNYSPYILILVGITKLLLTNICIKSGWKGGHFFPVIFSGVSIGYGISMIMGLNSAFCLAVITAAILGVIMRKPVAVTMLLLLCFPINVVPWLMISAYLGSIVPINKALKE